MWVNARWSHDFASILDVCRQPKVGKIARKQNISRPAKWVKLNIEVVNFNVDRASNSYLGDAAISGLMRNDCGTVLIKLSKSIGFSDSNLAEVQAIR